MISEWIYGLTFDLFEGVLHLKVSFYLGLRGLLLWEVREVALQNDAGRI